MDSRIVSRRFAYAGAAAAGLALVLAGGARLRAQSGDVIRACVGDDGIPHIVGAQETCKPGRQLLTWGIVGPSGAVGPTGPAGAEGPTGPQGLPGRDGRDASVPPPPQTTVSMTLTIPSISANPSPILTFSLGESNPTTIGSATGGAGAGKVTFSTLNLTKIIDALTVPLILKIAQGTDIPQAIVTVFDVSSGSPVQTAVYTFDTVFVTNDLIGANLQTITEQVVFAFGKLTSEITLNGTTFRSCWNQITNTAC